MTITQEIEYQLTDHTKAKGFLAYQDDNLDHKPVVMVVHDWAGRSDFYCEKAIEMANLGYVGLAIDTHGNATLGTKNEDKKVLYEPLKNNRDELLRRLQAAYDWIKSHPNLGQSPVAAIGFCFGGMCVLDMVRSGMDIKGVVSLHGLLIPPPNPGSEPIQSKILVLHGYLDSFVKPEALLSFAEEMEQRKADWQIHAYGGVHHSFSKPTANDPALGLHYHPLADRRSQDATAYFLKEVFQQGS